MPKPSIPKNIPRPKAVDKVVDDVGEGPICLSWLLVAGLGGGAIWFAKRRSDVQAAAARAQLVASGGAPPSAQLVPLAAGAMTWTCPFCRYSGRPVTTSSVTSAGWIIFFLMLFSCIGTLFCWLPLMIQRTRTVCPACNTTVGGG